MIAAIGHPMKSEALTEAYTKEEVRRILNMHPDRQDDRAMEFGLFVLLPIALVMVLACMLRS